jgi:hypothetical protein
MQQAMPLLAMLPAPCDDLVKCEAGPGAITSNTRTLWPVYCCRRSGHTAIDPLIPFQVNFFPSLFLPIIFRLNYEQWHWPYRTGSAPSLVFLCCSL